MNEKTDSCFDKGCPTKKRVTMPIGIMDRKSLAVIDLGSRCLPTRKEKAQTHLFVLFPSMSLKHLKPQSRTMNPHYL